MRHRRSRARGEPASKSCRRSDSGSGGGPETLGIGGLSLVGALVVGAVLVGRGSPQRRGFGLGMFVGWGLFVVVGAGACIALIAALSSTGG